MGPTLVLSAPDGPMLAPWTLLSGMWMGWTLVQPDVVTQIHAWLITGIHVFNIGGQVPHIYVSKTYLFGAKPLYKLMLPDGQLDPEEHVLFKIRKFFIQEMHLNISSAKMASILSRPQGDIYWLLIPICPYYENDYDILYNSIQWKSAKRYFVLTNWGQVMHKSVSKPGHHWFRQRLVAWSVPNQYLIS